MPSSTSHSERGVPTLALRLVITAAVTWAASAAYSLTVNPEVAFFKQGAAIKRAWVNKLDATGRGKIVVFGGSSCTVTVDGERMLTHHGLPVANLGLGAGMGARTLVQFARENLRSGDTLVVALEPRLLTDPPGMPALGIQFAWATANPDLIKLAFREAPSFTGASALLALRPGGYHVFTLIGKVLSRQPLYRYAPGDFHASGWQSVTVHREIAGPPDRGERMAAGAAALLRELRSWCEAQRIRIAFALPWGYCAPEQSGAFRLANADFLRQVASILPVLKDERLGVYSVKEEFADTPWHLVPEGAAKRTDALAEQLKSWTLWTPAELDRIASTPPQAGTK